jgi:glycosyltransferase involved in cell wall biosynthesis
MTADKRYRPQRILHIGKYFPPHRGGMETALRDEMNIQTRDQGLQVAAVVHSSERRFRDRVETHTLGYRVRHAARWFTAIFSPIAPFFAWSVYREIRELDPHEIKIHMPNASAFWLFLLPSAWARRWVILWHSDVLPSTHSLGLRLFYRFYKPFEALMLHRSDQIIATSHPYLESSKPLQPFRSKCVVVRLEIDLERIPARARLGRQPPKFSGEGIRVLCVGRLAYYKDFPTAVRAVADIPTAQLRIVGTGSELENLQAVINELGVGSRVRLLGALSDEDLWAQYTWCDVQVLPSLERTEAFGLVILEARCFNKATICAATAGSGMSAAQGDYPTEAFRPGDAKDLARILRSLAD